MEYAFKRKPSQCPEGGNKKDTKISGKQTRKKCIRHGSHIITSVLQWDGFNEDDKWTWIMDND